MTENTITLDLTDANVKGILTQVNGAVKSHGFYSRYVESNEVTRETVKFHAAAFADAWLDQYGTKSDKAQGPVQKVDGKRTKYGNAVQAAGNGLRKALDKDEAGDEDEAPVNLLTRAGLKAELADVIAAWEAAQDNN